MTYHNINVEQIDACLPQTQCQQCHYPRCLDYAKAIKNGEADINQCPPGGDITIAALAQLLDIPSKALNPEHGVHEPKQIAYIEESQCIGCTKCIQACPVSCIIGSTKVMHTIIEQDCTGCKLCIPACPTDCIELKPAVKYDKTQASLWPDFSQSDIDKARKATQDTLNRAYQKQQIKRKKNSDKLQDKDKLKNDILAALARKQNK